MKKLMPLTAGIVAYVMLLGPAWAEDAEEALTPEVEAEEGTDEQVDVAQAGPIEERISGGEEAAGETADVVVEDSESEVTVVSAFGESVIAPFSLGFGISYDVGAGTIFRDSYTTTDYHLMVFSFSASYATPVDSLSIGLSWALSKYLTDFGGSTYTNEARAGDLSLSANWGSWFYDEKVTGLNFSASLGLRFPTSRISRFTDLILALPVGLGISRNFGNLNLRYGFGVVKNFHKYTSTVADLDNYAIDVIARDGGLENVGDAMIALDTGVLGEWSISNSLSLSYTWLPGFSSAIGFSIRNHWSYDNGTITNRDQFTAENAEAGRGRIDIMTGTISTAYSFLNNFTVSAALSTSQMPWSADNQSIRFPWLDLETGNYANTSLSLGLDIVY